MRIQGFVKGVVRFPVLLMWALGLIPLLGLSTIGWADSGLVYSVSSLGSPDEATVAYAHQVKAFAGLAAGEFGHVISTEAWPAAGGEDFLLPFLRREAPNLKAAVVFSDLDVIGDYEHVPITLLAQLLIMADFAGGRHPSSISLARINDDFRDCSDLGKGATCTMKGGFLTFYENTSPIPEPGTLLLVGSGVLGSTLPGFREWRARFLGPKRAQISS